MVRVISFLFLCVLPLVVSSVSISEEWENDFDDNGSGNDDVDSGLESMKTWLTELKQEVLDEVQETCSTKADILTCNKENGYLKTQLAITQRELAECKAESCELNQQKLEDVMKKQSSEMMKSFTDVIKTVKTNPTLEDKLIEKLEAISMDLNSLKKTQSASMTKTDTIIQGVKTTESAATNAPTTKAPINVVYRPGTKLKDCTENEYFTRYGCRTKAPGQKIYCPLYEKNPPASGKATCVNGGNNFWYIHVGGKRTDWNRGTDAMCLSVKGQPVAWGRAPCQFDWSLKGCLSVLKNAGCV